MNCHLFLRGLQIGIARKFNCGSTCPFRGSCFAFIWYVIYERSTCQQGSQPRCSTSLLTLRTLYPLTAIQTSRQDQSSSVSVGWFCYVRSRNNKHLQCIFWTIIIDLISARCFAPRRMISNFTASSTFEKCIHLHTSFTLQGFVRGQFLSAFVRKH